MNIPCAHLLCIGDSITHGKSHPRDVPGGYRKPLSDLFLATGQPVVFVGSQSGLDEDGAQLRHEGWPGYRIEQIAAVIEPTLAVNAVDWILLLAGTNDIRQGFKTDSAPQRLEALIRYIARCQPNGHILVATAPPLRFDPQHPHQVSALQAYNEALPAVISRVQKTYAQVRLVDMHPCLTEDDICTDTVHPTANGYRKIAEVWHRAITHLSI